MLATLSSKHIGLKSYEHCRRLEMASWFKRTTRKAGNSGQRITRTTSNKGHSVYSTSKKVGNTRTTQSTSSKTGKTRIITTETHPTLGRKVTVKTLNPTTRIKKPKKRTSKRLSRRSSKKIKCNRGYCSRDHYVPTGTPRDTSWDSVIYVGFLITLSLLLFGLFSSGHWIIGSIILSLYVYYEYL